MSAEIHDSISVVGKRPGMNELPELQIGSAEHLDKLLRGL